MLIVDETKLILTRAIELDAMQCCELKVLKHLLVVFFF